MYLRFKYLDLLMRAFPNGQMAAERLPNGVGGRVDFSLRLAVEDFYVGDP